MSTKYQNSYLTDGCWSPTRPAVFCTSKMDGTIDVWDFIFKQNEPTLTLQVCEGPIQSTKLQDHGKLLAAGARDGSTTLIELSDNLSKIQNNEKIIFGQMVERESKREKTLESIARERRIKAQQKRPNSGVKNVNENSAIEVIKSAELEFFKTIQSQKDANQVT
jgi:dynein intermediate chain 2